MRLIGIKNTAVQTVATDGIVNIGSVYRKYCKKNSCGLKTFEVNSNGITLQDQGMYHVTATFVLNGSTAGDATIQLLENGVLVDGAFSTNTITTPEKELRTLVIDYIVLVTSSNLLGLTETSFKTIGFLNTGIDVNITDVVVNIVKEL